MTQLEQNTSGDIWEIEAGGKLGTRTGGEEIIWKQTVTPEEDPGAVM